VIDWAKDQGLLVDKLPPEWTPNGPNDLGGAEHHVFAVGDRYVKVTKPGAWGRYPKPAGKNDWSLGDGNLTNYLRRLVDQRSETGSDIRLHGILSDPKTGNLQVITSQQTFKGNPVDEDFIQKSMHAQGYQQIGEPGNYYNPKTNQAVLDLHDLNAVRQGNVLMPFDVIVMQPAGQLQRIFERHARPIFPKTSQADQHAKTQNDSLHAAPLLLSRSRLKGRAVLNHLPDHAPATEQECYILLRQTVAVYQSLYPALWRRFYRGSTSGRSGDPVSRCIRAYHTPIHSRRAHQRAGGQARRRPARPLTKANRVPYGTCAGGGSTPPRQSPRRARALGTQPHAAPARTVAHRFSQD
jgi:hypothetical protein